MTKTNKTKFVHDVATEGNDIVVKRPFRLQEEDQRRFIRLEISTPMSMRRVRDTQGGFWPEGDWHEVHGMVLNISAGGVLVDIDQLLDEGTIVIMRFTLQDVEQIDNVLGLVKRAEEDDGSCLTGIEFIDRSYLNDLFSQAELDLLPDHLTDFTDSVRTVLNKYIHRERVSHVG
jgi:hypothetical protein